MDTLHSLKQYFLLPLAFSFSLGGCLYAFFCMHFSSPWRIIDNLKNSINNNNNNNKRLKKQQQQQKHLKGPPSVSLSAFCSFLNWIGSILLRSESETKELELTNSIQLSVYFKVTWAGLWPPPEGRGGEGHSVFLSSEPAAFIYCRFTAAGCLISVVHSWLCILMALVFAFLQYSEAARRPGPSSWTEVLFLFQAAVKLKWLSSAPRRL